MKQLLLRLLIFSSTVYGQEHLYNYTFFTNSHMGGNYFFSKTSFQSPSFIKNERDRLPVSVKIFHTPGNALKLEYVNGKKGNWTASICRENLRGQDHFKSVQSFAFSVFIASVNTSQKEYPSYQLMKLKVNHFILYRFMVITEICG